MQIFVTKTYDKIAQNPPNFGVPRGDIYFIMTVQIHIGIRYEGKVSERTRRDPKKKGATASLLRLCGILFAETYQTFMNFDEKIGHGCKKIFLRRALGEKGKPRGRRPEARKIRRL